MECSNLIAGWHDASPSRIKLISVSMNVHGDTAPGREIEDIQEKLSPVVPSPYATIHVLKHASLREPSYSSSGNRIRGASLRNPFQGLDSFLHSS